MQQLRDIDNKVVEDTPHYISNALNNEAQRHWTTNHNTNEE